MQIKTESTVGSNDLLYVKFYSDDVSDAAELMVDFGDTPYYYLSDCAEGEFAAFYAADERRTWTLNLDAESAESLVLSYNGVVVANVDLNSANSSCVSTWSASFTNLMFDSEDDASVSYRANPVSAFNYDSVTGEYIWKNTYCTPDSTAPSIILIGFFAK